MALVRAALTSAALLAVVLVVLPAPPGDAAGSARTNGQIAYDRADPRSPDDTFIYTTNPDGSRARRLMARHTCCPSWSHDGRMLAIPASLPGDRLTTATVGADGRSYKPLPIEDPTLSVACAGGAWSPDDTRLACESWDDSRPSLIMQGGNTGDWSPKGNEINSRERPRQPDAVRSGPSAQTEATYAT